MDQVEHDPDFIVLSRHFKATAMELVSLLEQVKKKQPKGISYALPSFVFHNYAVFLCLSLSTPSPAWYSVVLLVDSCSS